MDLYSINYTKFMEFIAMAGVFRLKSFIIPGAGHSSRLYNWPLCSTSAGNKLYSVAVSGISRPLMVIFRILSQ